MKKNRGDIVGIFVIICIVIVFFYKTIFQGLLPVPTDTLVGMYHPWRDAYVDTFTHGVPFKNFLITDPIRQQIPWRKQVIDAFKSQKLPLWDATSFSGSPLLANIQSGALYPLNILFFLFPFSTAWTMLIMSQPLLAGIFLYLFLRHKKLDTLSSLVGAVCFSFSGFSIAWLTWGTMGSTILWLPLALLSFEKIHESMHTNLWRLILIVSVISSFFAGHIQIFAYSMCVFVAYALFTMRKVKIQQIFIMHIVIPVIVLVMTAPVWIRFISYLPDTSRFYGSAWTVEGFFIPFKHLVQFLIPDFFGNPATLNYWGTWNYGEMAGYIGVIGLFLAIIGISRKNVFWVGIVGISLLCAVDSPIARLPFIFHIPGVSSLQPTRLLSIIDFGLSILAAYGMSTLLSGQKKIQTVIGVIVLLFIFVGAWMSVFVPAFFQISVEQLLVVKRNLILPSIVFALAIGVATIRISLKKSWILLRYIGVITMFSLLSFELIRFGWKFTPFTDTTFFFPKTEIISRLIELPKPFRVLAVDDRLLPPNALSFYDIESITGYDPIHSSRYEKYIKAMDQGSPHDVPLSGFTRIITPKSITSPLLSLLNVQYVLSMDPLTDSNVRLLAEEGTTKLYKFIAGVPRVYLAENVILATSDEDVLQKLYEPSFIPGKTAVVEASRIFQSSPLLSDESATISSYVGDKMVIETITKSERLLVIGNMMDSHWNVTIDGKKATVYRVNYLFFGVLIPSGERKIVVQYR